MRRYFRKIGSVLAPSPCCPIQGKESLFHRVDHRHSSPMSSSTTTTTPPGSSSSRSTPSLSSLLSSLESTSLIPESLLLPLLIPLIAPGKGSRDHHIIVTTHKPPQTAR